MAKWKVPCVWQMMGYIQVDADNKEDAMEAAQKEIDHCRLPMETASYLEDSFEIDQEGEPIVI